MKLFKCRNCGHILYFENRLCERCNSPLGYIPEEAALLSLNSAGASGEWEAADIADRTFQFCANAQYDSCNWLVAVGDGERDRTGNRFCLACRHNRTIPDLSVPANLTNWRSYEFAKHRLFYSLIGLRIPMSTREEDPQGGLAFDFVAETAATPNVTTGHDQGIITFNLKEADDATRAQARNKLGEPYRTLLGHLRHESGHYIWTRLVRDESLNAFRQLFGDERQDYSAALRNHYANPPSPAWRDAFISAYAASHPWEDFAETWAHYLHIVDTMEMAFSFGTNLKPPVDGTQSMNVTAHVAPPGHAGFRQFIGEWLTMTLMMNSLNRCMGESDLYPFVLPPPVISKLEFIHMLVAALQPALKPASKPPMGNGLQSSIQEKGIE